MPWDYLRTKNPSSAELITGSLLHESDNETVKAPPLRAIVR
jgi:hypothetical protein